MENGSLGPPLRFKAVNTETGKESESFDLVLSDQNYFGLWMVMSHKFTCTDTPELCQSTGLHDAKGREIFFGDVALWDCELEVLYNVDWLNDEACFALVNEEPDTANQCVYLNEGEIQNITIIGNRHESRETPEARARELMGHA